MTGLRADDWDEPRFVRERRERWEVDVGSAGTAAVWAAAAQGAVSLLALLARDSWAPTVFGSGALAVTTATAIARLIALLTALGAAAAVVIGVRNCWPHVWWPLLVLSVASVAAVGCSIATWVLQAALAGPPGGDSLRDWIATRAMSFSSCE